MGEPGVGHNSGAVAADELRLLAERIERLEEEKKGIADDIRDVYGEAKSRGFDTRALRASIKIRKAIATNKQAYQEGQAILETYLHAFGIE